MLKDQSLHEPMSMPDPDFPVKLHHSKFFKKDGQTFPPHWHEENEFIFINKGSARIECNLSSFVAEEGNLVVVNSNDLHSGICLSEDLDYYCIIMNTSILMGKFMDICETKYLTPISQNRILFENMVKNDDQIKNCIHHFVDEYNNKAIGYELELKASLYNLLVLLLRNHVKTILTKDESDIRIKKLERFNPLLRFIDSSYDKELTLDMLSSRVNMSRFHFCRQFKELTGKTLNEYINSVRVNKAAELLKNSELSITEIALSCGFNDLNYFGRTFKKYHKLSASQLREKLSRN